MDNSLVCTDYDGTLKTKADFLASVKAAGHRPEPQVTASRNAHLYGDTAMATPRSWRGSTASKRGARASRRSARAASLLRGFIKKKHGCGRPVPSICFDIR